MRGEPEIRPAASISATSRVPHPRRVVVFAARVGLAHGPSASFSATSRVPHPRRVFVLAARVGLAHRPSASFSATSRVPHPRRVFVFAARVGLAHRPRVPISTTRCSSVPRVPKPENAQRNKIMDPHPRPSGTGETTTHPAGFFLSQPAELRRKNPPARSPPLPKITASARTIVAGVPPCPIKPPQPATGAGRNNPGTAPPGGRVFTVCIVFGANDRVTYLESINRPENSVTSQLPDSQSCNNCASLPSNSN